MANAADATHSTAIRPGLWRRLGTLGSTVLTAALAGGLIVLGASLIADRAQGTIAPDPVPPTIVGTTPLMFEPGYSVQRSYFGQVEPAQNVALAFETGGTVASILVDEGASVTVGQELARQDTRALQAERAAQLAARDALQAQLDLARRTADRQGQLQQSGFASDQRLDETVLLVAELEARLREIAAAIAAIDIALDKAVLRAPFDGEVAARLVDPGQTLVAGAEVLTLLQDQGPRFRVGLPPEAAAELALGDVLTADILGVAHAATLVQMRPDLDPRTRTQGAIFALDLNGAPPPYGQAGRITLTSEATDPGVWLPIAALREGLSGSWTVLTVTENGEVAAEAVEILHAEAGRVFARAGFPDGTRLVTEGPHRLVPGQIVQVAQ